MGSPFKLNPGSRVSGSGRDGGMRQMASRGLIAGGPRTHEGGKVHTDASGKDAMSGNEITMNQGGNSLKTNIGNSTKSNSSNNTTSNYDAQVKSEGNKIVDPKLITKEMTIKANAARAAAKAKDEAINSSNSVTTPASSNSESTNQSAKNIVTPVLEKQNSNATTQQYGNLLTEQAAIGDSIAARDKAKIDLTFSNDKSNLIASNINPILAEQKLKVGEKLKANNNVSETQYLDIISGNAADERRKLENSDIPNQNAMITGGFGNKAGKVINQSTVGKDKDPNTTVKKTGFTYPQILANSLGPIATKLFNYTQN